MNEKQEKARDILIQIAGELEDEGYTRKQNFSCLTEFAKGKIQSYCALGVLGCANNMIYTTHDECEGRILVEPQEEYIINYYGLSDDLKGNFNIMYLPNRKLTERDSSNRLKKTEYCIEQEDTITGIVTTLNDAGHFTFSEIASVLVRLADSGLVQLCSKAQYDYARNKVKEIREQEE